MSMKKIGLLVIALAALVTLGVVAAQAQYNPGQPSYGNQPQNNGYQPQNNGYQAPPPTNIYTNPGGATDNRGTSYSPGGDGTLIRGTDGTVMQRQGGFYLDTRTGQMVPAQ